MQSYLKPPTYFQIQVRTCNDVVRYRSWVAVRVLHYKHRRRRQGLGAAAFSTLEKFANISHNRAENRPKVGHNFRKQWIFYRAASLNFIPPTLMIIKYQFTFQYQVTKLRSSIQISPYLQHFKEVNQTT